MMHTDYELRDAPSDGVSAVRFSPTHPQLLLASSWDTTVRMWDVGSNVMKRSYGHGAPVLDCCWAPTRPHLFSAALDSSLKLFDIETGTEKLLGTHAKGIRCVRYNSNENLVVTGSWDATLKVWDTRAADALVGTYNQPERVFAMDLAGNRIIAGTAGRHVQIYDIRRMQEPEQRRESSLKYQTRAIAAFPDKTGYALSSIEGRVSIEYIDPSPSVQEKKYAFKCHRSTEGGVDTVYPVNTIAFHPIYGTFATGGCDRSVIFWDGQNQKRLKLLPKYPTSIASLSFSCDGTLLAVASSYTFEEGEKDHPPDAIFIHVINDIEVKPKARGTS